MSNLTSADLTQLLTAVNILNSDISPRTLADRTLKATLSLIPNSSMTAFDDICTSGEYAGNFWYSPPGTVPEERVKLLGELLFQHPCVGEIAKTREAKIFRTSDYLPLSKLHRTELYNEFYRIFNGEAQLVSAMRVSSARLVTCAIHRPKKNFTDREVEGIKLFTPHLRAAFKNAQAFDRIDRERKHLAAAVNRGIAVINDDGDIAFINDIAENLLQSYFDDFVGNKLPDVLRRYVETEGSKLDGQDYFAPAAPHTVRKECSELLIRLVFDNVAKELTLIFEEKIERSPKDFRSAGLTARESEVLFWISRGKTDREIALICSVRCAPSGGTCDGSPPESRNPGDVPVPRADSRY